GDGVGGNDEGIVNDSGSGSPVIVIRSQDGSEFSFTGIKIVNYLEAPNQIKFEAFRDGLSRGSVWVNTDQSDYISEFTQANGLRNPTGFQYVDEIRSADPNGEDLFVALDNIGFPDAVLTSPIVTVH